MRDPDTILFEAIALEAVQSTVAPVAPLESFVRRVKRELLRSIRAHYLLATLVLVYWAIAMAVNWWLGLDQIGYFDGLSAGLQAITFLYFGGLFILYLSHVMIA